MPFGEVTDISALFATRDGFRLVAVDFFNPDRGNGTRNIVLRSTDGAEWHEISTVGLNRTDIIRDATHAGGDRIIAVGSTGGVAGSGGVMAAWLSPDGGETWTTTASETTSFAGTSGLRHVITSPEGIFALGERSGDPNGPSFSQRDGQDPVIEGQSDLIVLRSNDGTDWTEIAVRATPDSIESPSGLVWGNSGLVVLADSINLESWTSIAYTSHDGRTIVDLELPADIGPAVTYPTQDGYVLLAVSPWPIPGNPRTGDLNQIRVWIAEPT